jgi:integrase/recombinase XerD
VERGRSPRTLASYRRDLASYQAFVAQRRGGAVIDGATPDVVAAYVASLRRTRSGATVARSLSTLRGFHRFLVEEGEAAVDPTADIPGVAVADLLPKALSEDETGRLLGAVVGTGPAMLRDRALLELLYGTGARVSEVVGLNLGDVAEAVDLGDIPLIRVLGKGSKERVVPLGRLALAAWQQWLSGEGRPHLEPKKWKLRSDADAVFLNVRGGRLTRVGAFGVVKKYADRVGSGRPGQPPRPAPLVRHPHAGPGGRHPGGPGAPRPRLHRHHPALHQGVARAPAACLRGRPPRAGTARGREDVA